MTIALIAPDSRLSLYLSTLNWALALALVAVGCRLNFNLAFLPGDIGDTRFNLVVLEHGYLWLSGRELSFWSPSFFYPATNVLAYSDSHLGTLWLYAGLRALGLDRESSLQWWVIVNCVLNFASALWIMRRLSVPILPAAIGAYVFTFGLPMIAQLTHLQLVARMFVPIGFYVMMRWLERKQTRYWYLLLATVACQLYISIYTGFFLMLCLAALALAWQFKRPVGASVWNLRGLLLSQFWHLVLGIVLMLLVLLPLAWPHYQASRVVGVRSWDEISSMLPQVFSFFRSPFSLLWRDWLPDTSALPAAQEHALFLGGLPLTGLAWSMARWRMGPSEDALSGWTSALLLSLCVTVFATVSIGGFSFYRILALLPGVGGIRAVTRIIVVMLFPIAMLLAGTVASWRQWVITRLGETAATIFVVSIGFIAVMDQRSWHPTFSKQQSQAMVEVMRDQMRGVKPPVVFVKPVQGQASFVETPLTAMLAAQDLGLKLVNGYSGSLPPGYSGDLAALNPKWCDGLRAWVRSHPDLLNRSRLALIGPTPVDCPLDELR